MASCRKCQHPHRHTPYRSHADIPSHHPTPHTPLFRPLFRVTHQCKYILGMGGSPIPKLYVPGAAQRSTVQGVEKDSADHSWPNGWIKRRAQNEQSVGTVSKWCWKFPRGKWRGLAVGITASVSIPLRNLLAGHIGGAHKCLYYRLYLCLRFSFKNWSPPFF